MKFYSIYGNCQGMIFASFLNNNPVFLKNFQYIPLTACNLITPQEIERFIRDEVKKLDLFIYIPISDDYRNDYKFSSNFFLEHLRPDCLVVSFPSLYFFVYDRQMTYLTDRNGVRVSRPHEYHDRVLIRMFMTYRHLRNDEITAKYLEYINTPENFDRAELIEAAQANCRELKRREDLLGKDQRNHHVLKIADYIRDNYQEKRLFYSLNHPSRHVYLHLREQVFRFLGVDSAAPDLIPGLDPHMDYVFGIYPPVRRYLGLKFEDNFPFPSNAITSGQYLDFYRGYTEEELTAIGIYPLSGTFFFKSGWSGDEGTHRWAVSASATISVFNDQKSPLDASLFFTLLVVRPQTVKISLNGTHLTTTAIGGSENSAFISTDIQLVPGENILTLTTDTQPASPSGDDPRLISFGVSRFSVVQKNKDAER